MDRSWMHGRAQQGAHPSFICCCPDEDIALCASIRSSSQNLYVCMHASLQGILWNGGKVAAALLGQDDEASARIGAYCKQLVPGLPFQIWAVLASKMMQVGRGAGSKDWRAAVQSYGALC